MSNTDFASLFWCVRCLHATEIEGNHCSDVGGQTVCHPNARYSSGLRSRLINVHWRCNHRQLNIRSYGSLCASWSNRVNPADSSADGAEIVRSICAGRRHPACGDCAPRTRLVSMVWPWSLAFMSQPKRLGRDALSLINRADAQASVTSIWEICSKAAPGKLKVKPKVVLTAITFDLPRPTLASELLQSPVRAAEFPGVSCRQAVSTSRARSVSRRHAIAPAVRGWDWAAAPWHRRL